MQKNIITNKISPCCSLPFSVIYWWVSNLILNSESDRQFILSKMSQNGTISIEAWKVLINSGTLESDSSLTKDGFLALFDCERQPSCSQLKIIIEGFKIGNWIPELFFNAEAEWLKEELTTSTVFENGKVKIGIAKTGTYPNAGGLIVDENTFAFIVSDGNGNFYKTEIKLPNNEKIEERVFSFKLNGNESFVNRFNDLVKNIYINSTYKIDGVEYLGVNEADWRKFLIMLKSNDKLAAFIIDIDDLRNLKGQTVELLDKEEDLNFRNSTRVWVEFNNVDFPTKAEFSFLKHNPQIQLFEKSFNYKPITNTFKIEAKSVNFDALLKFYNLVENVYISSKDNSNDSENFKINYIFVNQYDGIRKILFYFEKGSKIFIFYTEKEIISGSKKVKLENKENDALNGYDCFIDFKDFGTFPSDEFSIQGLNLKLTNEAFRNESLLKDFRILELEKKVGEISTKTSVINVSKELNGNNVVQLAIDNITDASLGNRYVVKPKNGFYAIYKKEDFIGNPSYPAMICPKNHIDIEGQSRTSTIFYCDLSESAGTPIDAYQTMYNWANDVKISNLTLITKNLRYVLHQDNPQEANGTRYYENVDFIFIGNGGYMRALGTGTYSGSRTFVTGGSSQSQVYPTFTVHNNTAFEKPSLWHFKNHNFITTDFSDIVHVYNCGSNQDCEVILENCSFSGGFVFLYEEYWLYVQNVNDHLNHANWRIRGVGNSPFYFKNQVNSKTLAIETKSKTKSSKVRFDKNSSAYPLIIKNNKNNYFGHLGNPNRKIIDDYVVQNGGLGLSAFAFGGLSILELYTFGNVEGKDGLGIRLGNCSTNNKTLGIEIDGVNYNVVFNKNYTSFTNSQVIAEINAVIGSVATAKEFNFGADYYAEMTDVVSLEINNSTTEIIPKGTIVSKVGSKVKICQENETVYGMTIDDIAPYELDSDGVVISKGRIIKNCYISLDSGNVSSVRNSGNSNSYKVVNGVLTPDINGILKVFSEKYIKI